MSKNKRKYIKSLKNQRRTRNGAFIAGTTKGNTILERLKYQLKVSPHKCNLPASVIKYITKIGKS